MHLEAAAVARAGREDAVLQVDALAHPHQAVPAAVVAAPRAAPRPSSRTSSSIAVSA